MTDLWLDVRRAFRALRANPGFTAVAVCTLALGLGATTAIYSVVDHVLLRPLRYPDADRLARVWHLNPESVVPREPMAYETFRELDSALASVDATAGVSPRWNFTVRAPDPERAAGYWVSASFFPLLGATPAVGRVFGPADDAPGAEPVVVLSHAFWTSRFGGDPGVVGRAISVEGHPVTVVGVMRADFRYGEDVDLWAPLALNPLVPRGRQVRWVDVIARLAPGATVERARRDVAGFTDRLARAYPGEAGGLGGDLAGLYQTTVGDARTALWTVMGGVGFVLLIACANIANLLLARASARGGEVAVRTALGASRRRLLRLFLTESAVLAGLGGIGGLGIAVWLLALLRQAAPAGLPRLDEVALDGRVLLVAAVITLGTGLVFGLAPAFRAARGGLDDRLRVGRRSLGGGPDGRLRDALVVAEVALALVLLAGAGLLAKSFVRLTNVDGGFRPEHVLTLQIAPPATYDALGRIALFDRVFDDLERVPGVVAAGGTTRLPLGGQLSTELEVRDHPVPAGPHVGAEFRRVSAHFFDAMGIPITRGRAFDERDTPAAPGALIVSRSLAARLWPGDDPIGKQARSWAPGIAADAPWATVVGVVGDVKQFGLDADAPAIAYFATSQGPPTNVLLAVRASGDPAALAGAVRARLRAIDPEIVQFDVRTMTDRVAASVAGRRFSMLLVGAFGGLALLLAAVGLYGVLSYTVRQRTRELGIRMALGAAEGSVLRLVVGGGMRLTAIGLALGLLASLPLTRLIRHLLFAVSPTDPAALASVTGLLVLVALLATVVPARRAARTHPMEALRHE